MTRFPKGFQYTFSGQRLDSVKLKTKNKMQPSNPNAHAEHFCETVYLNSLVHFSPVTIPVHRRLWNMEEGGEQSVECGV